MKLKKLSLIILLLLFFVILFLRIHYSYETFSDDESFYYLEKLNFLPDFSIKILFEFLFASSFLIAFLICLELTDRQGISILSSFLTVFTPLYFKTTFNSLSEYGFVIFLLLISIYSLLRIRDSKFQILFVLTTLIFSFVSQLSLLLLLTLLFYWFIIKAEGNDLSLNETYALMASVPILIIINFIQNGFSINIIPKLIEDQFKPLTLTSFSYLTGFLSLFLGLFGLYYGYFKEKSKKTFLLTSVIISIIFSLSLRLITFKTGIIILGVFFSILSSISFPYFIDYFKKTRIPINLLPVILILFILFMGVFPSINESKQKTPLDLTPILWLKENTKENSKILANVFEGNQIKFLAKRNVILYYPFKEENSHKRFKEIRRLFTTINSITANKLLDGNNIDYIYFSQKTKDLYEIEEIPYINNIRFNKIYEDSNVQIWELKHV